MNGSDASRFLVRMILFSIIFRWLSSLPWSWWGLQAMTARLSAYLISMLGYSANASGIDVVASFPWGNFMMEMDRDCIGWKSMFFLLSLVLSTPSPKHVFKSFIFLPAIYIINIGRIVAVAAIVSRAGDQWFGLVHVAGFGIAMSLVVIAMWVAWMRW